MIPAADLQLVNSEIGTLPAFRVHTEHIEYPVIYSAPYISLKKDTFLRDG